MVEDAPFVIFCRCHSVILSRISGFLRRIKEVHKCMISNSQPEIFPSRGVQGPESHEAASIHKCSSPCHVDFLHTPQNISDTDSSSSELGCAYRVHLAVDPEVLCEIVRFIYTGDIRVNEFDDPAGLMTQLFIQADYLSIDPLVERTLLWFRQNDVSAGVFYELESVFSRKALVDVHNENKLHSLLIYMLSRNWKGISENANFSSLSFALLLELLRGGAEKFPISLLYKWNTFCDKDCGELESIKSLLVETATDPDFIRLVDLVSKETLKVGNNLSLSSLNEEVQSVASVSDRKYTIVISGLKENVISLQQGKFMVRQCPVLGVYEVSMRNESEVEDPAAYITGSSERMQMDLTIGGPTGSSVSIGDRVLLRTRESFSELKIKIEYLHKCGEKNKIYVV